jgi:hypothetical protein
LCNIPGGSWSEPHTPNREGTPKDEGFTGKRGEGESKEEITLERMERVGEHKGKEAGRMGTWWSV